MTDSNQKNPEKESSDNMTFEQAIARVEEIVRMLESGSAPLEEEIALYEEAVKLTEFCTLKLQQAELKIRQVSKSEAGNGERIE